MTFISLLCVAYRKLYTKLYTKGNTFEFQIITIYFNKVKSYLANVNNKTNKKVYKFF